MATKTISITQTAYNKLANMRRENESFSIVIERIVGRRKLNDLFGILSKESGAKLSKAIKENRKRTKRLHEQRNKKLKGAFS